MKAKPIVWVMLLVIQAFILGCGSPSAQVNPELRARLDFLVSNREFESALPLIDSLMVDFPNDAELCFQKAKCLSDSNQAQVCLGLLETAQENCSKDAFDLLRQILEQKGLIQRYGLHDHRQAYRDFMDAYDVALTCNPTADYHQLDNLSNAGQSAIGFGDYVLADSIAKALIKAFPNELHGYDLHVTQLSVAGKYAEAILAYDTVLAHFENVGMFNGADYYYQRGEANFALGNLASACADWQEALGWGMEEAQAKLDSLCAGK